MIRSMTGFGSADRTWQKWAIRVEARSVNHSEFKLSVRLPEMLRLRESELNAVTTETVARGHVYITAGCDPAEAAVDLLVDKRRLAAYLRVAKEVAAQEGVPVSVDAGGLIALPGVMNAETLGQEDRDALWENVKETVRDALRAMVAMREAEGRNLCVQLRDLCAAIRSRTDGLDAETDGFLQRHRARLAERVRQLLEGVSTPADETAIAREVAIQAERSDVSEEITRMYSHLEQLEAHLDGGGEPVGRTLEFLAQEMLREANTTAAKLPGGEQVQQVIQIKADVQRLREQARNVE
ncbi:MAG: YicC/YloC family endoribonuclease [Candidatus Brocadiia bacterium]|jgi:uncharacterized protein (TIGR00255 family)|nr:YicC/YloC family endoribonuclease [Candidatus Brocadiia bacterium]